MRGQSGDGRERLNSAVRAGTRLVEAAFTAAAWKLARIRRRFLPEPVASYVDQVFARDRGDPSHSMKASRVALDDPAPGLMHRRRSWRRLSPTLALTCVKIR